MGRGKRRITGAIVAVLSLIMLAGTCGEDDPATVAPVAPTTMLGEPRKASRAEPKADKPKPDGKRYRVSGVIDGDTVDLSNGKRVRLIGIDTPEKGECGYGRATNKLEQLVDGKWVRLVKGARDNTDRHGRLLRYVDVGSKDAGARMISTGYAKPRYNSTDGYGRHDRERRYAKLYRSAEDAPSCPKRKPGGSVYYENCAAVRDAGKAPISEGDPGYASHLDRDGDGTGCE